MCVNFIGIDEVEDLYDKDTLLIDMRSREEYDKFHLEHAISVPYENLESWLPMVPDAPKWILYCQRGNNSLYAAKKLASTDRTIYTIFGGVEALCSQNPGEIIDSATLNR